MKNVLQFLNYYNSPELSDPLKNKDMMPCLLKIMSIRSAQFILLALLLVLPLSLTSQNLPKPSKTVKVEKSYRPQNAESGSIKGIEQIANRLITDLEPFEGGGGAGSPAGSPCLPNVIYYLEEINVSSNEVPTLDEVPQIVNTVTGFYCEETSYTWTVNADVVDPSTCGSRITRTWSTIDNYSTIILIINVGSPDLTLPTPPDNALYQCEGEIPPATQLSTTDPCTTNSISAAITDVVTQHPTSANYFEKIIKRTWTFTSSNGTTSSVFQIITVKDTTPPSAPDAINIIDSANPDSCDAIVNFDLPTGNDDCSGAASVTQTEGLPSGSAFPIGESIVKFSISDASGNTVISTINIIIFNPIASIDTTCQSITINLVNGNYNLTLDDYYGVNNNSCEGYSAEITDGRTNFTCDDVGQTFLVELRITDEVQEKYYSCYTQVTIADPNNNCNQPPNANCKEFSISLDENCEATIIASDIDNGSDDPDGDELTYSLDIDQFTIPGTYNVELTVSDGSLEDTCTTIVTVIDDTEPGFDSCPDNITVNTDAGQCTATVIFDTPMGTDNCSGVTVMQTAGIESGSPFPIGTTTITFTATDGAGNTTDCSFDVIVENITTETLLTVSPNPQQYSDLVTLRAEVSPYDCGDAGTLNGTTVTFKIGTQEMGTADIVNGVAELVDVPLLEPSPFGTDPTGQMAPGIHTVSAHFSNTNTNFIVNDPEDVDLAINKEEALVDYTGQTLQATPSSSSSSATVLLSANIQDKEDGYRGDIRNAQVRFVNRDTDSPISGWIPVSNLINANDTTLGTVSFPWSTTISGDSESYTIGIIVNNGYYIRDSSEDDTVVTIYKPVGDFITGGGYILPNSSSGLYASTSGLKTNFGFNVGYTKKGNRLKGHMNIIFRRMESDGIVHVYQIKSNSIESLGVNISNVNEKIGTFIAKSNLTEITDPLNIISLGGNLTLKVDLTDRGNPGTNDEIAFNLTNNGALWYSSNWTGISTSKMLLSTGDLVIQSGFNLGSASRNSQDESVSSDSAYIGPFEVRGWPNPSDDQFYIQLKTTNAIDEVSIKVYDVNGRLVHTNVFKPEQQYSFGKELKSGMYFVNISQQDTSQTLRMVKF